MSESKIKKARQKNRATFMDFFDQAVASDLYRKIGNFSDSNCN